LGIPVAHPYLFRHSYLGCVELGEAGLLNDQPSFLLANAEVQRLKELATTVASDSVQQERTLRRAKVADTRAAQQAAMAMEGYQRQRRR